MSTISYELAKMLKEAGFPQEQKQGAWWFDDHKTVWIQPHLFQGHEIRTGALDARVPTLSELIEACPKKIKVREGICIAIFDLCCVNDKWIAWYEAPDGIILSKNDTFEGVGFTPEEAVANLYLALHQK